MTRGASTKREAPLSVPASVRIGGCLQGVGRDFALLQEPETEVAATEGEQILVRTLLDDLTPMQHDDAVAAAHGRKAVRDDDARPAARQPFEAVLDQGLGLGVDVRGRLVEYQHHFGVEGDATGEGQKLLLAGAEVSAALDETVLIGVGKPVDEAVGADQPEPWRDQEGKWWVPRYQTSVMVWDSDYGHRFWEALGPEHVERLASDQDFFGEVFPDEGRMPTEWFSLIQPTSDYTPASDVKVVLTSPIRNDEAARRHAWAARLWC